MSKGPQVKPKDLVTLEDVEVTLRDVIQANEPLQMLGVQKFPVMLSYKISKTVKVLDKVTEEFTTRRTEVLDKYGKLDEKSKRYTYENPEDEKKVNEILNGFLDEKVTVRISKIKLEELARTEIEPRTLALLDWIIVE